MKPLKEYHLAWLSNHSERTQDWLRFMLKAGFDIHHIDGDHANNNPTNLVLIEHRDHMRLHGATRGFGRELEVVKEKRRALFLAEGKIAYEMALEFAGSSQFLSRGVWVLVGQETKFGGGKALNRAKLWAVTNGLTWPLFNQRAKGA